ncbi:vascular endothelial growth factor receptor 1-like [Anopheles darlingi]|uniref:vascular endothelial growth factor receptor 1-like n=1 Tax=Anopheles darlingi TaxID=43151 RepID=UPI0021001805|nr:vascular endothelial growth factor receptor 1-like [Anopheles darlingi]
MASNSEGSTVSQSYLLVQGVTEYMRLEKIEPIGTVIIGENVTFNCAVVRNIATVGIDFMYKDEKLEGTWIFDDTFICITQLTLPNVGLNHSGDIICNATTLFGSKYEQIVTMTVKEPIAPHLRSSKIAQEDVEVDVFSLMHLECDAIGTPDPDITWFKNGMPIVSDNNIQLNYTTIIIENITETHSGLYECVAENKIGNTTTSWNLTVRSPIRENFIVYIVMPLLLLIIIIAIVCIWCLKKKKKSPVTLNLGVDNVEYINPNIPLIEQVDRLPYNTKYDFPKQRLKLLTQIGSGAFGVVMKAIATGIKVHEESTIVAVKIVKHKHDDDAMRALLSELKIMVHLGRHLNVVNLLGVVTQNITEYELMVIVEYCPFGNLQDYLQMNRFRFMDQLSQRTGELLISKSGDCDYQYNVQGLKYVTLSFSTDKENCLDMQPSGENQRNSERSTAMSPTQNGAENTLASENLQSFEADDTHGSKNCIAATRSINTTDLICWAAQIASGMEYLASRKVMHGDLAARNVLLCDDNVVKICDFGFARSIYRHNVYKKSGEAILPFKWLAVECISDNVFNSQSDVWAYGILLWELFSLAMSPYPGLEANLQLYQMLREGYRMEQPQFANLEIYEIMLNCWAENPHSRPSFQDLRGRFYAMLPDKVQNYFSKLNEPYIAMNSENMKQDTIHPAEKAESSQELAFPEAQYVNFTKTVLSPISDGNLDHLLSLQISENIEETDQDPAGKNRVDLEQMTSQ